MTTPEERAHQLLGDWIMGPLDMFALERAVAKAIREAIKEDNLILAALIEARGAAISHTSDYANGYMTAAHDIAAGIRARLEAQP